MAAGPLSSRVAHAIRLLQGDLESVFGSRLESLVLYGRHVPGPPLNPPTSHGDADEHLAAIHTLALVSSLLYADLAACATRAEAWNAAGLAMPLLLLPEEFASSLDAFPLEYGAIIANHLPIVGHDPFQGVSVRADDRRRACEAQAKSHLIHLREGFLQAEGQGPQLARLIHRSVPSFTTLLANVADLDLAANQPRVDLVRVGASRVGLSDSLVKRLLALRDGPMLDDNEAAQLYPPYLDASERLARFVDTWKETAQA
jgi:hypothetical protein